MANTVIRVENISKKYQLGSIGTGTFNQDLSRWWAKVRGKEDPTLKIGTNGEREGEHWALRDMSFDIQQGDAVGIIGKNGAGKSTLLKILSRVTTPTSGRIRVKGRIASLLEVGTGFHPDLSGRDNIFMNGAILGMSKAEIKSKFNEIVDFSGVEKYIDTPVKRYSSGMYVRLAFAVAAHLEPEILVVDEVLAVGDADFQKKCLGKMQSVAGQGRTVIFVSHNMNAVNRLCNKGVVLKAGEVQFMGNVSQAVNNYLQLYSVPQRSYLAIKEDFKKSVQITEVKITDIKGRVINHAFRKNTSYFLFFTYKVYSRIDKLHLAFHIKNSQDEIVFFSDIIDSEKQFIAAQPGTYEVSIQIPNPMLIPDTYLISIGCVNKDNGESAHVSEAISFEIVDLEGVRDKRPGYIYQPLNWEIKGVSLVK
jgi:lipopolysaccharide transport system ATP-binding protein